MKLMIFDINGLLNWQYYGYQKAEEENKKTASEAVMAFITKMCNVHKPEYVAGVMDLNRETTWRRKLYPDYKAQRKECPEELKQEKNKVFQLLRAANIPVYLHPEYEADDFAGSLAKKYENQMEVILVTKEQDYLQLVNSKTTVWLIKKDENAINKLAVKYGYKGKIDHKIYAFTPSVIEGEYNVKPEQINDLKGFTGDSSDNIPGIKGLGQKAVTLLQNYKTMEDVYFLLDYTNSDYVVSEWKKIGLTVKKYDLIKENKEIALLSKKLATIVTDLPVSLPNC